jgi:hypothetical protein
MTKEPMQSIGPRDNEGARTALGVAAWWDPVTRGGKGKDGECNKLAQ